MKGKKLGGRKKGTPNKVTGSIRETLMDLCQNYQSSGLLNSDFMSLEAKDRLYAFKEFLPYLVPKQQAVQFTDDTGNVITIEDRLKELSESI